MVEAFTEHGSRCVIASESRRDVSLHLASTIMALFCTSAGCTGAEMMAGP